MFASATSFRAFTTIVIKCSKHTFLRTTTTSMAAPPTTTFCSRDTLSAHSSIDASPSTQEAGPSIVISLQEWQAWGTHSPLPTQVAEIVDEMIVSERESDAQMKFGGLGGKLKGDFKTQEDKKHRAKYRALDDSEQKLHFFSARQIACRILGSRGYLCQKCWLPLEDCMCSRVVPCSLWHRIRFWLYMHPKDFLRQNNTGKLLWQVFGINAATLCIFGIAEHEEIMWKTFMHSGRNNVWCLYPNKNAPTKSVEESFVGYTSSESDQTDAGETMNFILIDGTWSNSAAMFRRLKAAIVDAPEVIVPNAVGRRRHGLSSSRTIIDDDYYVGEWALRRQPALTMSYPIQRGVIVDFEAMIKVWEHIFYQRLRIDLPECALIITEATIDNRVQREIMAAQERADLAWGDDLPCISLTTGASPMHRLRPQPSWDRTCTAAAAIGLLDELHLVSQFSSLGLDKQAEAVENSVDVLLASLTARRLRMGRSISRAERHHDDIC
ncbi:hypothetical protein L6452_15689 [Arctium lappa]|uniref:Uncharacterized protein n=1 Tax=Arctium lappa TaxID=4217 RepID=A0ACB9CPH2_ARCLA|nr:hypothetical protein L6452_15689 [Arctium lappa]